MELHNKNESPANPKRPTAITVICIIGFIGFAISVPTIFSGIVEDGGWYPNYLGLSALIGLVCLIGMWQMKKWAVFAYTAFAVLNQILVYAILGIGWWNITGLIVSAIVITVALAHVKKMSGPENSWIAGSLGGVVAIALMYFMVVQPGVETENKRVAELEARLENLSETTSEVSIEVMLAEEATRLNRKCPIMLDDETRLDSTIVLANKTFQYNHTLVNTVISEIDVDMVKTRMESRLTQHVMTHYDLKKFRDNKVNMAYSYADKNGALVFTLTITPEMYSLLNTPVSGNN